MHNTVIFTSDDCDERHASSSLLHNNDIDVETVDVKPDIEHVLGQSRETGCEMFIGECEMVRVRAIDVDKSQDTSVSSSSSNISSSLVSSSGENPYKCEVCHQRFTALIGPAMHKRVHAVGKRRIRSKLLCGLPTDQSRASSTVPHNNDRQRNSSSIGFSSEPAVVTDDFLQLYREYSQNQLTTGANHACRQPVIVDQSTSLSSPADMVFNELGQVVFNKKNDFLLTDDSFSSCQPVPRSDGVLLANTDASNSLILDGNVRGARTLVDGKPECVGEIAAVTDKNAGIQYAADNIGSAWYPAVDPADAILINSNVYRAVPNEGNYTEASVSCAEVTRSRKRKACPSTWKRNIRIHNRVRGLAYMSRNNTQVPEKSPRVVDCTRCRFQCAQKFNTEQRWAICKEYYGLADTSRQKDYICATVEEINVKRRRSRLNEKVKTKSRIYHFMSDGELRRVCRKFYCQTLCISSKVVDLAHRGKGQDGSYQMGDGRRGRQPWNKKSTAEEERRVVEHIGSFPRITSRHCIGDSQLEYVAPELTVRQMYHLYRDHYCIDNCVLPVSEYTYRSIFDRKSKYKFFEAKEGSALSA